MLTQEEQDFISYWKANRLRRKKISTQFLIGIPVGLAFVIPIVINFASGWYKRADMEANSPDFNPGVLLIALLLIVAFTAIFYQRHRWDQYEQHYIELLAREDHEGHRHDEDLASHSDAATPAIDSGLSRGTDSEAAPGTSSEPAPGPAKNASTTGANPPRATPDPTQTGDPNQIS